MYEVNSSEPPRVSVTLSYTRNMGDYESMKMEVGVSDSSREGEKVSETYKRVKSFVESKLIEEMQATEAALSKARGPK